MSMGYSNAQKKYFSDRHKTIQNSNMTIMNTFGLLILRLQPRFNELIKKYIVDHVSSQNEVAKMAKIGPSELNKILQNKRPLTAHYISLILKAGLFTVADIYDGKAETPDEKEFWAELEQKQTQVTIDPDIFDMLKDLTVGLDQKHLLRATIAMMIEAAKKDDYVLLDIMRDNVSLVRKSETVH